MRSSGVRLGFRLAFSLVHLGPESLALPLNAPFQATLPRPSPDPRKNFPQILQYVRSTQIRVDCERPTPASSGGSGGVNETGGPGNAFAKYT